MIFELILALLLGLVFAGLLTSFGGYRTRRYDEEEEETEAAGVGIAFLLLFLLLTAFTWAGGLWITPFGPLAFGIAWLPFLVSALALTLVLAAALPRDSRRGRRLKRKPLEEGQRRQAETAFGVSFILALCLAILAIGSAYVIT